MNRLEQLIEEGKELQAGIKFDALNSSKSASAVYTIPDRKRYFVWLNKAKLFLATNFPNNILAVDFIDKMSIITIDRHTQLVAILEALLGEYAETNDVKEQLRKLEDLEKVYETVKDDDYDYSTIPPLEIIRDFHAWHDKAVELFYKYVGEGDEIFQQFIKVEAVGNQFDLSDIYDTLRPLYIILKEKVKNYKPIRSYIHIPYADDEKTFEHKKLKIFISYSHKDKLYFDRLLTHLKVFRRWNNNYEVWTDTNIKTGDKWKEEIEKALNAASIAILLVSTDFLASDFVMDKEVAKLLDKSKKEGTIILPIIISPCMFAESNIAGFQAANDPNEPLSDMTETERDKVFIEVLRGLNKRIENR